MSHSNFNARRTNNYTFSQVPRADIQRSKFNRSHGYKSTINSGILYPIFLDEVLPGDTFNLSMTMFCRFATLLFPIMDNLYIESFFFFVPSRLVYENWERLNGQQDDPDDTTDYVCPEIKLGANPIASGSLGDYFGLPTTINNLVINAMPFRCYNLIWNDWFRDENLQDSVPRHRGDGPDPYTDYQLLRRGKRHDYFTSCLPWPQKINDGTVVTLPLGQFAPVEYVPASISSAAFGVRDADSDALLTGSYALMTDGSPSGTFSYELAPGVFGPAILDPNTRLRANLADATAASINQLRQAFQLQRFFEADARGGTRYYPEIIKAHFNVTSDDARFQRPEYLGGGMTPVNIHTVPQTSGTPTTGTPQGNLSGFGTAVANRHGFTKSFTEHGYILGLVSVRADLSYQQGLDRLWTRSTRYDFFWPTFAHLGEQAVLNREIYYSGSSSDTEVFGYQERYAEYRYKPSLVTGLFRSNASGTLDSWHLAQHFTSLPTLSDDFIFENPPTIRVKAVTSEPDFLFDAYIKLICARPMPVYSVPGFIDHF